MATTIPNWVPKLINQVVAYRERQQVTHERLNELFNLLIVQGDFNTNTLKTLNDNLAAFDLQYLTDVGANTEAHQTLLSNFTVAVNQMQTNNAATIANLDTQQRQLMASMLSEFETNLAETETNINTELTAKLAAIQTLRDEMFAKEAEFDADMAALTNTVEDLRADILADNQAIATQVAADRLAIETMISVSQQTMQNAQQVYAAIDQSRTYKVAGGTGTALTVALNSITAYYAGMAVHIIASANNGGAATTLKVDALAALPIYKQGTTVAPTLIAGRPYTFIASVDLSHFFPVASATGNAIAEHVLAGDTFSNQYDTDIVGTLPIVLPTNLDAVDATDISSSQGALKFGIASNKYYNGVNWVSATDANFTSANLLETKPIFGMSGTIPVKAAQTYNPSTAAQVIASGQYLGEDQTIAATTGTAVAADTLAGKTFNSANGIGIVGTMPVNAAQTATIQITGSDKPTKAIPAGYTPGGTITVELATALAPYILSGYTVGGVAGTAASGKKFASGTVVASTDAPYFTFIGGGGYQAFKATVSGLTFKPRLVILKCINTQDYLTTYNEAGGSHYAKTAVLAITQADGNNLGTYAVKGDVSPAYVINGGFCLPVAASGKTYYYEAYE